MNPARFALKYQAFILAACLLLFIGGVVSFLRVAKREDPEFLIRSCLVITEWPGATATDVQDLVTDVLEESIGSLDEVRHLRSESRTGVSIIYVDLLEEGLEAADVPDVWDQVQKKVNDVVRRLPETCRTPYVNRDFGATAAMLLALYPADHAVDRYSPRALEDIADELADRLRSVDSVARVELHGTQDEVIEIETTVGQWTGLSLSVGQLQQLLERENIIASGSAIDTSSGRYSLRPTGQLESERQINDLRAHISADRAVRLEDLGLRVRRRYADPPQAKARYGDLDYTSDAIILSVDLRGGFNVIELGEDVQSVLHKAKSDLLPEDVIVCTLSNTPRQVSTAIGDFIENLVQAVLIVLLVAYLLIGLRVAVIMASAIPLVMVASMGLMTWFDVDLNTLSIASLIVALGLVVDNTIEVCDNAENFQRRGENRFDAITKGVRQIAFPIFISTITTVFAFLPMLTIPGNGGEYIRPLPIVVSITLLVSYVLACTFTPILAYRLLPNKHRPAPLARLYGLLVRMVRFIRSKETTTDASGKRSGLFNGLCHFAVRHPILTALLAFAAFGGAVRLLATGQIGNEYFPYAQRDQLVIDIKMADDSSFYETEAVVKLVEEIVDVVGAKPTRTGEGPRIKNKGSFIGEGGPRFFLSMDPEPPAPNVATMLVNVNGQDEVLELLEDLNQALRHGIPEKGISAPRGAQVYPHRLRTGPPIKYPIVVRLLGEDPERLQEYSQILEERLRAMPMTRYVENSWGVQRIQLEVALQKARAGMSGVTHASLTQNLSAFFEGTPLTYYREGDRRIPVLLRLGQDERKSLRTLDRVYIESTGQKVPLASVAEVHSQWLPTKRTRRNQRNCLEVRCQLAEGVLAGDVFAALKPDLERVRSRMNSGERLEIGGEQEKTSESQGFMERSFQISFALIFLALMALYNSFGKTLLVVACMPLAATGGLLGLYLADTPMGFMAMLGLLSLAGIVINDALVLIEFIIHEIETAQQKVHGHTNEKIVEGLPLSVYRACVVEGTRMRITPIMLTTLTTIGGLLPLALWGGPLFESLAVVVIFGLAYVTVLIFFVLPALLAFSAERLGLRFAATVPHAGTQGSDSAPSIENAIEEQKAIEEEIEPKPNTIPATASNTEVETVSKESDVSKESAVVEKNIKSDEQVEKPSISQSPEQGAVPTMPDVAAPEPLAADGEPAVQGKHRTNDLPEDEMKPKEDVAPQDPSPQATEPLPITVRVSISASGKLHKVAFDSRKYTPEQRKTILRVLKNKKFKAGANDKPYSRTMRLVLQASAPKTKARAKEGTYANS